MSIKDCTPQELDRKQITEVINKAMHKTYDEVEKLADMEMEEVTKLFKLESFDIYIIGGGACILGEYTTRATLDIDFVEDLKDSPTYSISDKRLSA